MATTAAAIRDRMRTVIEQLVPRVHADVLFRPYVADLQPNPRAAFAQNPQAAFRSFLVVDLDDDRPPITDDADEQLVDADFEIVVGYSKDSRTGDGALLDRRTVMRADAKQIKEAIGMHGAENFTTPHPAATWIREGEVTTYEEAGQVDIVVIRLRMQFYRTSIG